MMICVLRAKATGLFGARQPLSSYIDNIREGVIFTRQRRGVKRSEWRLLK